MRNPTSRAGAKKRIATATAAAVASAVLTLVFAQTSGSAQTPVPDALPYATSYLTTGDYAAGGVDTTSSAAVDGLVTGTIHMGTAPENTVPAGADILAAFVYWETIYDAPTPPTGAKFRGIPLPSVKVAHRGLTQDTPCWAATGNSGLTMAMFRADVLPFLPVGEDKDGNKNGRRLVNDADLQANGWALHTITLPQAGGNLAPESAGASLVVVYRDPAQTVLKKIVLHDGIYVQQQNAAMNQTLRGFYQSAATKSAKMTHILGSGAKNHTDNITFNDVPIQPGIEPFIESGTAADRTWFTKTYDSSVINPLMPLNSSDATYGERAKTQVSHSSSSPYECMAWAAVLFSTSVADVDHDGLPDGLENASAGLKNPNGEPLPNLNAMGASSGHKDLFVEINAMTAATSLEYGGVAADPHDHLPTPEVLKMVGDMYAANGITPHFDVGDTGAYHTAMGGLPAAGVADAYLVGSGARGGERIAEAYCVETPATPTTPAVHCEFPAYPGTVGWKFGFEKYRDAPVGASGEELAPAEQTAHAAACDAATTKTDANCRRRFDPARDDLFHYALYAHARARPKSTFPCLDASHNPAEYSKNAQGVYTGTCAVAPNPNFGVPKSISGTADLPGSNLLITLGLWGEAATPFVVASTTVHELGHNLNLWHGGVPAVIGTKTADTATYLEPNCKPNYLSSMSYLYQVHGMFNNEDTDLDGYPDEIPHLGYSGQIQPSISETAAGGLGDGAFSPAPVFRPAWFVPATSDLAVQQGLSAATKYCNGSRFPFNPGDPLPSGWVDMARATAANTGDSVDWNGNLFGDNATQLNVNFDGTPLVERLGQPPTGGNLILTSTLFGFNDWAAVRLDQMGAGRASGRFKSFNGSSFEGSSFEGSSFEGSSFEGSSFEGSSFEGSSFEGSSFEGSSFEGSSFEGSSFEGSSFEGSSFEGSSFEGSSFEGSSFEGSSFEGSSFEGQEIDLTTANSLGRSAPNSLKGCVIGRDAGCTETDPSLFHRQRAGWKRPTFGTVGGYHLYRFGGAVSPAAVVGAAQIGGGTAREITSLVDPTELPDYNACFAATNSQAACEFTYFVKADMTDDPAGPSANSNFARVKPTNDKPVASPDAYNAPAGETLSVAAPGVLNGDTDDDSNIANAKVVLVTGPGKASAFTLNADGGFSYTPQPGATGTDSFTYKANSGLWSPGVPMSADSDPATVTITLTDTTPPKVNVVVPAPTGLNSWFNTKPVSVSVTATDPSFVTAVSCTDNGSAVPAGSLTMTGIGTQTATGTLSVSAEGTHSLVCIATDGFNNTGATLATGWNNTGSLKIDTVAPVSSFTVGPTFPTEGEELAFGSPKLASGSAVTFGFAATDPPTTPPPAVSGVASIECKLDSNPFATCTSPKSFSGLTLGPHTFTVRATDNAGNVGAEAVRNFKVVYLYALTPLKTSANIGSAVQVVFSLKDQFGVIVNTLTATVPMIKMESIFNGATVPAGGCVASAAGTPEVLYSPATGAAGGSDFRYVSGGYQFNWDSTTAKTNPINTGKGCYTVRITLSDGSNPKLTNGVQLK